jgi:hypothetical protein
MALRDFSRSFQNLKNARQICKVCEPKKAPIPNRTDALKVR